MDEIVHVLETTKLESGQKRVRTARGWSSIISKKGQPLLQAVAAADPPAPKIKTTAGCICLPHSHEEGKLIGSGCLPDEDGVGGWCDVEPGCAGAQERTADYAGFDTCQLDSAPAKIKTTAGGESLPFGVDLPSTGSWGIRFGAHTDHRDAIGVAEVGGASAESGLIKVGDVMLSLGGVPFRPGMSNEEALQHIGEQKQLAATAGHKVVELLLRRPTDEATEGSALASPVNQGMPWDDWSVLPAGEEAQCQNVALILPHYRLYRLARNLKVHDCVATGEFICRKHRFPNWDAR